MAIDQKNIISWFDHRIGPQTIIGSPFDHVRDGPAMRVNRHGIYDERVDNMLRLQWARDPVKQLRTRYGLHEPVGTNLINTEDLRKFIGWTEIASASVTVTQGQTIAPQGDVPGSPAGEATRIETSGGTSVEKYRFTFSGLTGDHAGRMLLHNQGGVAMRVTFRDATGGVNFVDATIGPGESVEVKGSRDMAAGSDVRIQILALDESDSLDCLAWGPMLETGVVASTFPGLSGTTRPTDQLTRVRDWGLSDIQGGATWWFDLVSEGAFADTGGSRRLYTTNDGSTAVPDNGIAVHLSSSNSLIFRARGGAANLALASEGNATVNTWGVGDRIRLAFRLIADSGQHRLRIDYRRITAAGVVQDPVIGTASILFNLFTTISGTRESFFSRGNGVEGCHVAALAGGLVQHEGGTVPTFTELEEEFA